MPRVAERLHALGALGIGALGTLGVVALSLGMNAQVERRVLEPATVVQTEILAAATPKTAEPARAKRTAPPKRAHRGAPSPGPLLASGMAGLDFGLGSAADFALAAATDALLGGDAVTIDEAVVQQPPRPTARTAPTFPVRARSLGQSGRVTLSFVVDVDGSVQDAVVVEAAPPGVFDQSALEAVRSWRFDPGRHEGLPVAVRVRQSLVFELE